MEEREDKKTELKEHLKEEMLLDKVSQHYFLKKEALKGQGKRGQNRGLRQKTQKTPFTSGLFNSEKSYTKNLVVS